jgi:GntR family transcriptional regulator
VFAKFKNFRRPLCRFVVGAHTDEKKARLLAYASGCYLLAPIKKKKTLGLTALVYYSNNTLMQASASYFQVNTSSGVPIYRQLMDQVRALVASGRLAEGDLLPSVRQLGQDLQVNQMTVSKAYSLLERDGVVERVRGQGMRVNHKSPRGTIKERQNELRPLLEQVATQAYQLALTREQVLAALDPLLKERGSV